jgi:hypothetical protein
MRIPLLLGPLVAAAALTGCGYVGDPLPPALNLATRVTDLRAVEFGDKVLIDFTIPELTTDQLPLRKVSDVELRVGPGVGNPFDTGQWAAAAQKIPVTAKGPGAVQASVAARDWIGKELVIGVRVVNLKGRASDWSNLAILRVITPLSPPTAVAAVADPAGVRLVWSSPATKFRVFRRDPGGEPALLDSPESATYVDKTAEYGKRYEYLVQALTNGAESEISEATAITPRDIFPPAPPVGLNGVAAPGSAELVWERNQEPDLRGYRVYRADGEGAFERIAEMVDAPAYSDRKVEAGKTYRYAVSALDQAGNESEKSAIATIAVQ